ncbi:hypothetical protein A4X13_0g3671 [Tilletia indica]|uniref:Cystinosin n=1 Tax=Tilletia indica TaxID=43049 RepID=A0A177TI41_9BASI|nr:hypothetical protein A4X13_0g3671 [Tilletia indica]
MPPPPSPASTSPSVLLLGEDGAIVPLRKDGSTPVFLTALSHACGWIYVAAWSASFYPQVILNARRKSVAGFSLDFAFLNAFGFLCYAVFNLAFFASPIVREQYRARHGGQDNIVRFNDVAFAVHAFILTVVTVIQTLIYHRAPTQRTSRPIRILIAIFAIIVAVTALICVVTGGDQTKTGGSVPLEWIDFVQILSSIKLCITFIKYLPQIHLNYKRKSTLGWSIENILLDLTGGVFSLVQLFIDSSQTGDWSSAIGDFSKLGLGLISIGFDLIFITQHYVLYGAVEVEEEGDNDNSAPRDSNERTGLLAVGTADRD